MALGDGTLLKLIFENWDQVMELFACFTTGLRPEQLAQDLIDGDVRPRKLRRMRRRVQRLGPVATQQLAERFPNTTAQDFENEALRLSDDDCDQLLLKWAHSFLNK